MVPRTVSGQPSAPRAAAATDGPRPTPLFDANGDGVIENWSIAHGGDSFANFDPPPSGTADAPDPKPHHSSDAAAVTGRGADRPIAGTTTPAAVHHAHEAYQRDGMAGTPPTTRAPVAAPVPAPAAPAR